MPRYYFHLVRGSERINDEEGETLDPDDLCPEILLNGLERLPSGTLHEWNGWSVEIRDEAGQLIQVLPFADFDRPPSGG
jgi:hypothetical protein